eukprot:TRINITY_DN38198_c0_g1_i11.p1 TRINITY_DN38198_c0_g1~~TRINITY_DN38198_c0_g1_i11.p1  ORF type:complete len:101 (-),score=13.64 TRINITY_DN38198_c0_g1_i11:63-365(-)
MTILSSRDCRNTLHQAPHKFKRVSFVSSFKISSGTCMRHRHEVLLQWPLQCEQLSTDCFNIFIPTDAILSLHLSWDFRIISSLPSIILSRLRRYRIVSLC